MWNSIYEAIVNINGMINDFVWVKIGLVLLIGSSKATSGWAREITVTTSMICRSSVAWDFKNLRLAGTLKKRSFTTISVPGAQPVGKAETRLPPLITTQVPS